MESMGKQRVALVLSGGGARGLAQIGVLKAFDEFGIQPDCVVGNSMGAIVAALYAAGYSADSIRSIVLSTNWDEIFVNSARRSAQFVSQKSEPSNYMIEIRFDDSFRPHLPRSISFGQTFFNVLVPKLAHVQHQASQHFDSLPVPLRIVATDILNGKSHTFTNGNLVTAIRSSCGIPLVFSPYPLDSMLLMDGGLSANIPVTAAREADCSIIIAVDVTSPLWPRKDLDNPVKLVDQIVNIGISQNKAASKEHAALIIEPDLAGYMNTDFSAIDTLIDRGYRATRALQERIVQLFSSSPPASTPSSLPLPQSITISGIPLQCIDTLEKHYDRWRRDGVPLSVPSLIDSIENTLRFTPLKYSRVTDIAVHDSALNVTIDPGIIRQIDIEGNRHTSAKMIRNALDLTVSDTLSGERLSNALTSLFSTTLFETVNIEFDQKNTLRVQVEEKYYTRVRAGVRFDEFHRGEMYIQPGYENVLGWGIDALVHLQYGYIREKYAFEFVGNHLFRSNIANTILLQSYLSKERIISEDIDTVRETVIDSTDTLLDTSIVELRSTRTLRKAGVTMMLGAELGKSVMLSGGIRLEKYIVNRIDKNIFADWTDSPRKNVGFLMAKLMVDNTDRFPFPTSGNKHYISLGGAHRTLGSDKNFVKINGKMQYFYTPARHHTFASNFHFAWSSTELPEVEKIYLGGILPEERYGNMRVYNYVPFIGLKARSVPGDMCAILRMEYSLSFVKNLYFHLTADWGHAWKPQEFSFDTEEENDNLVRFLWDSAPIGIGTGAAYVTPVGTARVSIGRLIRNPSTLNVPSQFILYFSVGQDF
jgi:predicted acylesterase/phospholipase RssA